jgi:hypothetical protein
MISITADHPWSRAVARAPARAGAQHPTRLAALDIRGWRGCSRAQGRQGVAACSGCETRYDDPKLHAQRNFRASWTRVHALIVLQRPVCVLHRRPVSMCLHALAPIRTCARTDPYVCMHRSVLCACTDPYVCMHRSVLCACTDPYVCMHGSVRVHAPTSMCAGPAPAATLGTAIKLHAHVSSECHWKRNALTIRTCAFSYPCGRISQRWQPPQQLPTSAWSSGQMTSRLVSRAVLMISLSLDLACTDPYVCMHRPVYVHAPTSICACTDQYVCMHRPVCVHAPIRT